MKVMTEQDHFQVFSYPFQFRFVIPSDCFSRVKQSLVALRGQMLNN